VESLNFVIDDHMESLRQLLLSGSTYTVWQFIAFLLLV